MLNLKKSIYLILIFTFSFSVELLYDTQSEISGFQFKLAGADLLEAYGGAAEEAGFLINYNPASNMVIAFTMDGSSIPEGQGNLINIDYSNESSPCIEDLIVSNASGNHVAVDMTSCFSFTDGCHGVESCDIANIAFDTQSNIYGFEFQVTGAEIVDVYGGAAEEAGFQIAFNSDTGWVVAFSLEGTPISAGVGSLLKIEYIGEPCLNSLILAGDGGIAIESFVSQCLEIVEGCENTDECGVCDGNGDSCAECESLSEWGCNNNSYCDWVAETVSCSGLSSSQCDAASGCSWVSGGGGGYGGGGSSYCSGGTGEINGLCFEIECKDLAQDECETDSDCNWIPYNPEGDYETVSCSGLSSTQCSAADGCNWVSGGGGYGGGGSSYCSGGTGEIGGDPIPSHCKDAEVLGCTSVYADNYNPEANTDDGSCEYGPLGTLSFHNFDYINGTVEVHLNCEYDVSNFEFSIDGLDVSSFSGGSSHDAGFDIELIENTLVGESTSDNNIPSDSGLLAVLSFNSHDSQICFSESWITTYIGIEYEAVLGDCIVTGCLDELGCNYNSSATDSDGNCSYPFCDGTCDSGAYVDDCGVCAGENIDMDCEGVCFGAAVLDCLEECNGDAILDECGECEGDNYFDDNGQLPDGSCDCSGSTFDCAGVCAGETIFDECGVCGGSDVDCCPGDLNDDDTLNVLDVVALVDVLLTFEWPIYDLYCSDFNNDGILNILDLIIMVESTLERASRYSSFDATNAKVVIENGSVRIDANGYVAGAQITLVHEDKFSLSLTNEAMLAEYRTVGNRTNIVIVGLESEKLFRTNDSFEIEQIIMGNLSGEIYVELPSNTHLGQAYPNPFNPTTTINFQLNKSSKVVIDVYNLNGVNVATIADDEYAAGAHSVSWNASSHSSGVYLVRMTSGSYRKTQKIMLLK